MNKSMKSLIRLVENVENETDGLIVSSGVGSRIMSSCSHMIGGTVGLLLPETSGIAAVLPLPAARTLPYLTRTHTSYINGTSYSHCVCQKNFKSATFERQLSLLNYEAALSVSTINAVKLKTERLLLMYCIHNLL